MSGVSSVSLFQRLRQDPGDEQVWKDLIAHYSPWILGWATRALGRRDVAEDVVQTVLLRIWQNLDTLLKRTEETPRRWISTVVHNLLEDWRQKPDNWRIRQFEDADGDEAASIPARLDRAASTFEDALDLAEQCEAYVLAWDSLAEESALMPPTLLSFLYRVRGGLTSDDVAGRLNLTRDAVNTNVRRVRVYFAGKLDLSEKHARWIDQLDVHAREIEAYARRLERSARAHGYLPVPRTPPGLP